MSSTSAEDEMESMGGSKLTLGRRVTLLEKWSRLQAKSITEITRLQSEASRTLAEIAQWKLQRMIEEAKEEERQKALNDRLARIEKSLIELEDTLKRVVWLIVTPILGAIVLGSAAIMVLGVRFVVPG
jgi:seryl-tRNA synthetase